MDAGRIQTMAEQLIRENPKRRILDFTLEGQKYWIKRKLGNGRNQLVKYSVEKEFYYEIARMTIAGKFHPELVPHMVCLTPDYMVTLDGGPTLKNVLGSKREEEEKKGILEDTGAALASLHHDGIITAVLLSGILPIWTENSRFWTGKTECMPGTGKR